MNRPILFLHIGSAKTGTTAIQTSLFLNKNKLDNKGIYLTNTRGGPNDIIDLVRRYDCSSKFPQPSAEMLFEGYMRRFNDGGYNSMLISAEGCFSATPFYNYKYVREWIKTHFDKFEIKIICYLRRQDFFVESIYNQTVKGHYYIKNDFCFRGSSLNKILVDTNDLGGYNFNQKEIMTPFDYFAVNIFPFTRYDKIISKWAELFGKENILIRAYERSQLSDGLIADFYSKALGFTNDEISELKPIGVLNESINRDVLEFQLASGIYDTPLFKCIDELSDDKNTNTRHFTNEERKRFMAYHEEGNSFLAREYLGREEGKLFYDEIEDYEPYQGLSKEKALLIRKKMVSFLKNSGKFAYSDDDKADLGTLDGIVESARYLYYRNAGENCIQAKVKCLLDTLAGSGKTVVIYGVFGQLAEWVFKVACLYERSMKMYVADRKLEEKSAIRIENVNFVVADISTIKKLQPHAILITAAFSGKEIRKELEELGMAETAIYPVYDFSDRIWSIYPDLKMGIQI